MADNNWDAVGAALKKIVDALYNAELLNKMGLQAIHLIKKRTRQGKDIDGKAFKGGKGYSEGWERVREARHLPVDRINLEFDDIGGMLQKVDHVVFNDLSGVAVDITDDQKKKIAYYLSVSGAGKNRVKFPFWGLNNTEKDEVLAIAENQLELIIEELE